MAQIHSGPEAARGAEELSDAELDELQREYEISGTFQQHCVDLNGEPLPTFNREARYAYTTDDVPPVEESDFATPVPSVGEEKEEEGEDQQAITAATGGSAGGFREQPASDAQIGGWFRGQPAQVCCFRRWLAVSFRRWKWNCLIVLILLFQVSHDHQSLSWPYQATVSKPAAFIYLLH